MEGTYLGRKSAGARRVPPHLPPIVPPEKPVGRTIYLMQDVWDELDAIAEATKDEDPRGEGYSRNRVVAEFVRWAIDDWKKLQHPKKK